MVLFWNLILSLEGLGVKSVYFMILDTHTIHLILYLFAHKPDKKMAVGNFETYFLSELEWP